MSGFAATLGGAAAKDHVYRESVRAGFADRVDAVRSERPRPSPAVDALDSLTTAVAAQEAADSGRLQELHESHPTGVM